MLSPGRTTDASAEDILMAPDVACSIPNGKWNQVGDDEGTLSQKFNCLPGVGVSYRYQRKRRTLDGGAGGRGAQT